jgi:opacity protein-like surface antigen
VDLEYGRLQRIWRRQQFARGFGGLCVSYANEALVAICAGRAGVLIFDPTNVAGANTQTRAAFVYGGGVDFNLTGHLFVRAQYRGLIYNSPTYDPAALSGFDRVTHRAEPSVGFGWRF